MDDTRRETSRNHRNVSRTCRPTTESLEHRQLPTTIVVNTFADILKPPPGEVSLRSAISEANRDGRADTIVLPAGTYEVGSNLRIARDGPVTIEAAGGLALVLEVLGKTPGVPVNNTVFTVGQGARVRFVDLAISGGVANQNFTKMQGGGLINRGNTTLVDCILSNNTAEEGGGIENEGDMTIQGSVLTTNTAQEAGGAIRNQGTLTIRDSFINQNTSGLDAGGIFNIKTVRLIDSQVVSNKARRRGGGIWNLTGRTILDATRVSGNTPNDLASTNGGVTEVESGSIVGGPAPL